MTTKVSIQALQADDTTANGAAIGSVAEPILGEMTSAVRTRPRGRFLIHVSAALLASCAAPPPAATPVRAGKRARQHEPVRLAPQIGLQQRVSDIDEPPFQPPAPAGLAFTEGHSYWGGYKICVAADGAVNEVTTMKLPATPVDNEAWVQAIRSWKYEPYLINGKAVPFCTLWKLEATSDGVVDVRPPRR